MAIIQVTPEQLRSDAGTVRQYKAEHDDVMAKLGTLILGLSDSWKGEAQDAFVAKYNEMQPTFKNFSEMLEGYAKLMDTSAQELESTDQSLRGAINSFA